MASAKCRDTAPTIFSGGAMTAKGQHVAPAGGKWKIHTAGAGRASGVFETEQEAIIHARERARREGAVLYVHDHDGRIRERIVPGDE